ncbi:MAG: hypothetical protein Q9227_007825 [Pyrenula ochraceoflavens]
MSFDEFYTPPSTPRSSISSIPSESPPSPPTPCSHLLGVGFPFPGSSASSRKPFYSERKSHQQAHPRDLLSGPLFEQQSCADKSLIVPPYRIPPRSSSLGVTHSDEDVTVEKISRTMLSIIRRAKPTLNRRTSISTSSCDSEDIDTSSGSQDIGSRRKLAEKRSVPNFSRPLGSHSSLSLSTLDDTVHGKSPASVQDMGIISSTENSPLAKRRGKRVGRIPTQSTPTQGRRVRFDSTCEKMEEAKSVRDQMEEDMAKARIKEENEKFREGTRRRRSKMIVKAASGESVCDVGLLLQAVD